MFCFGTRKQKNSLSVWHTCTAGGCGETENLTVPEPFEPGTEAIRQEFLINSRLSASQTPGLKPCVCPGPSGSGTLRFSRLPADARRTRMPHAQGVFRTPDSKYYFPFSASYAATVPSSVASLNKYVCPSRVSTIRNTSFCGFRQRYPFPCPSIL